MLMLVGASRLGSLRRLTPTAPITTTASAGAASALTRYATLATSLAHPVCPSISMRNHNLSADMPVTGKLWFETVVITSAFSSGLA